MNDDSSFTPTLKRSTLWKIRGKSQWSLINSGQTFRTQEIWIRWYSLNNNDPVRLGCAVSKKYGNAVVRNAFKRRVREVIRKKVTNDEINSGTMILVGPSRYGDKKLSSQEINNGISAFISSLK